MNTLKPLLIIAIIGGIGYGAWSRLNRKPDPSNGPGWEATPTVQLSGAGTNWSPGGAPSASANSPGANPTPTYSGIAPAPQGTPAATPPALAPVADPNQPAPNTADGAPVAAQPMDGAPPFANEAPAAEAAPAYDAAAASANPPAAYPQTDSGAGDPAGANPNMAFAPVLETARRELDAGRLADGLLQLSAWYDSPKLSPGEQQQLNELLDQVAGTVIYSTHSFGEVPYEVQPGERLEDIAARYNVSSQLLAKINGVEDPRNLRPGERLKVLRGPFNASINLDKRILTLWIGDSYAGRFKIGIGHDLPPREGDFTIDMKDAKPVYHGAERAIEGGDPSNPLGTRWLGMAGGYGIHGTNDPNALGSPEQPGCIAMSQRDVEDLYDILIVGSRIKIHR